MAINPCKECGGPVSDKAESCPMCGAKQPKPTSIITWIVLGLIIFTVLITMYGGSETSTSNTNTGESAKKDENKAGVLLFFAQQQIKQNAKDPDSVQFRSEQIHEKTDEGAVACGEYNAKNSFGAYVGFKKFVVTEKDQSIFIENGSNAKVFVKKWNKHCVK